MSDNCTICKAEFVPSTISTGYGIDKHGHRICFSCCGKLDERALKRDGKLVGYLTYKQVPINYRKTGYIDIEDGFFTNWPGTFKIRVLRVKKSFNNFRAPRLDFWFMWQGMEFHGVNVGNNSQVATVKRVKGRK